MKNKQGTGRTIISIAIVVYTISILMWLGMWFVIGDGIWWLMLVHRAVPFMFVPLPFLAVSIIVARCSKWLWLMLSIPLFVFGSLYYPYLMPRLAQHTREIDVSVMTYNVLFSNQDYDAIAEVILTYRPDFVALQEVEAVAMTILTERLQTVYPYTLLGPERQFGTTAILSQHEIIAGYILDLESEPAAVMIRAQVAGTEITFVSAHLVAYGLQWVKWFDIPQVIEERTVLQNRQAQLLLEALPTDAGVVLLGCDCNANETSTSYRTLATGLTNAARVPGKNPNTQMPSAAVPDRRLRRLDYVFYRGEITPVGTYRIREAGGSDHMPVLAQFELAGASE